MFICFITGSSGDESDSSRGGHMEVPRGLEVIPLSPKSDNNYNSKESNKKVNLKALLF